MEMLPAALAASNPATAIAGAVISGVSAFSAARYKAQVSRNNALIADRNATQARKTATINAQEQDLDASQEIGAMIARMGGSGLSLGVGSLGRRVENADELAAKDRANIIFDGDVQSAQFSQQADDFRSNAKSADREALFGLASGAINIGESALSSASRINARKIRALGAA